MSDFQLQPLTKTQSAINTVHNLPNIKPPDYGTQPPDNDVLNSDKLHPSNEKTTESNSNCCYYTVACGVLALGTTLLGIGASSACGVGCFKATPWLVPLGEGRGVHAIFCLLTGGSADLGASGAIVYQSCKKEV